ncbi:putative glycoside hydrolase [Niabella yanshanensis]|uniref:Glycoside hydrolase n=1 Tax=Niabella yanshanensis TaxID=577386 RepID=A0ABZ0W2W6_9BACT|nr:putative glycoside hydrolase [Niabella yanshanensis]WQD36973.1 putative glycoside hydrolase [Niabella yanshanensis]
MKLLDIGLLSASLLLTCFTGIAQKDEQPLRLQHIPSDGVPYAQIFDSRVKDASVYQKRGNKFFFIWGATKPDPIEGVTISKYFPSYRNPERQFDIEWYKKNHPDWIIYKEDKVTPAYGYIYDYGGLVPLDVSNPEVREFYLKEFMLPAVKQGYKVVAMDNVDLGNWPGAAGKYDKGKWVQLYTGKKNDKAFQENMIGWMRYLSENLNPLGVQVAANIKANSAPNDVVLRMMHSVNIWLDENGFTHTGKNITGSNWQRQFDYLKEIALIKGYISINQVEGAVEQADPAQIEWVIANFLLTRGPQSLLAITPFIDKKAIYQEFHYRPEMNVNIGSPVDKAVRQKAAWTRKFTKGMVVVNPSATETVSINLPKGKWKTIGGQIKQKTIQVAPASGFVLTRL